MGPAAMYWILATIALIVLGVIFRRFLFGLWSRHFSTHK
jgi:hypothetical protein